MPGIHEVFHPLSGSDPLTLARVLARNRGGVPRRRLTLAVSAAAAVARSPISVVELAYAAVRTRVGKPMQPPIFILGHWRSGTTHLYNILGKADRFGYVPPLVTGMPWDMLLLGRLLKPVLKGTLPEQRFIDRVPVHVDSPQEDEAALANMQPVSFYHGLYFPHRLRENLAEGLFFDGCSDVDVRRWQRRFLHFLRVLHVQQGGRRLVIKNPVYTARPRMLLDLLPGARFVHIHRDPIAVFRSMRKFYAELLKELSLRAYDPWDADAIDGLILETYPRMMDALIEQTAGLPPERFVELRYTDLDDDPLAQVKLIYDRFGVAGFDEDRPRFEAYLASIGDYKKNRFDLPPDLADRVYTRWRKYFDHWGYSAPDSPPRHRDTETNHL